MPDNVNATWILCVDEESGELAPVYSEPKLMVSPFELNYVDQYPAGKVQRSKDKQGK